MLNNKNKLFFPKIKYEGSTELKSFNSESKIVNLYYLDWQRKELKSNMNNTLQDLPHELNTKVKNLKFIIDTSYLNEIRRTSWQAITEWNEIRNIADKSAKKIYLKPTASYVESAFKLLADCIFDIDTEFYYRQDDKVIIPYLLLYKFWKNQASKNLILDFACIPELMVKTSGSKEQRYVDEFLSYVRQDIEDE